MRLDSTNVRVARTSCQTRSPANLRLLQRYNHFRLIRRSLRDGKPWQQQYCRVPRRVQRSPSS